jgi:hypothetical protein
MRAHVDRLRSLQYHFNNIFSITYNAWSAPMRLGSAAKLLFAQILLTLFVSQVSAAPCIAPPLSPDAVNQFKGSPQALIAPDSDTRTIEATARDLAATDPSLAAELVNVAHGASPRFKGAIAAGLAQAAVACQTVDQQAALLIQQAAASFDDGEFQNVFAAVAGDLSTAAVAAAAESAVSAVGSVVVVNPTGSRPATTNFGGGGNSSFFQIAGPTTISAPATTTSTTTTTSASPVSTTR